MMKWHLEFVSDWSLIANILSYCVCLIHEDKITKQALKQKFENDSEALGVYTKYLISHNHFHVMDALIWCVCLYFRVEIGHIKHVNAHLACVCWWCKSGNPLRSVGLRMWSKIIHANERTQHTCKWLIKGGKDACRIQKCKYIWKTMQTNSNTSRNGT